MLVTVICVTAICALLLFAAHYIGSAYEDFKSYMSTEDRK
jgi:hypothetical protein